MKTNKLKNHARQIVKEALDKYYGAGLKKYLQGTELAKDLDMICYHGNYYQLPRFLEENDPDDYLTPEQYEEIQRHFENNSEYEVEENFLAGEYNENLVHDFAEYLRQAAYNNFENVPTREVMDYTKTLPGNTWLIHFSDNAEEIWEEGFKYGTVNHEELGYSFAGHANKTLGKEDEGILFAFPVNRIGSEDYGRDAVVFQANAVQATHYGDEEEQAMFYSNDARNIVYLKHDDDGYWNVTGADKWGYFRTLFIAKNVGDAAQWAINNFDQYRKWMLNPREYRNKRKTMRKSSYNYNRKITECIAKQVLNEVLDWHFGKAFKDHIQDNSLIAKMSDLLDKYGVGDFPEFCKTQHINLSNEYIQKCLENDPEVFDDLLDGQYSDVAQDYYDWKTTPGRTPSPAKEYFTYNDEISVMTGKENPVDEGWLIHFSDNADKIWREGFRYSTADLYHTGISNAGKTEGKAKEGLNFAYPVKYGFEQMYSIIGTNYGKDAVLFQANCVVAYHNTDHENQAVFYNNDARNLIFLKHDLDSPNSRLFDKWCVMSNRSRVLYYDKDLEKVAIWAIKNFRQYAPQMLNPNESAYRHQAFQKGFYGKPLNENNITNQHVESQDFKQ